MIGPVFPGFVVDRSPNAGLPGLHRGHVGFSRISCGIGFDRGARVRAAGEALERQFGYTEHTCETAARFEQFSPDVRPWLGELFAERRDDFHRHTFDACEARMVGSQRALCAPSVLFTLAEHKDDAFVPVRDSSGSALHFDARHAVESAVAELFERQALTAFWYHGHANGASRVDARSLPSGLSDGARSIVRLLRHSGQVLLIDISLVEPYRVCLAVYLSESGNVRYAAGASSFAHSRAQAQNKAVLELYQAFVLMDQLVDAERLFGNESPGLDSIAKGYFAANRSSMIDEFKFCHDLHEEPAFEDVVDYRRHVNELRVMYSTRCCRFARADHSLHCCRAYVIDGFFTMSAPIEYQRASRMAQHLYGFDEPVRTDSAIPFG